MRRTHHRRKVERIRLLPRLAGLAGAVKVELVEISVGGARLHHFNPLRVGHVVELRFRWKDEDISIPAAVIRSSVDRFGSTSAYVTGVRFEIPEGSSRTPIKRLIESFVRNALDEQFRNATGATPAWASRLMQQVVAGEEIAPVHHGDTIAAMETAHELRDEGYVRYTFSTGRWTKTKTWESQQPGEGFTIWHFEDDDQVDLLCKDYEHADEATRALIRLCAELSLIVDDTIPPQHFVP